MSRKLRLAVLISGGGTTLRNLIDKIEAGALAAEIALVVSSTPRARGIDFARAADIPVQIVDHSSGLTIEDFSEQIFESCRQAGADLVVMGGFLKRALIPDDFENRVINIHPSLIPEFCGKGFYGIHVHKAVLEAGSTTSGCTVHYVDDQYDHGPVIAQQKVSVEPDDTPEALAKRVFAAECELLPAVIQRIAESNSD